MSGISLQKIDSILSRISCGVAALDGVAAPGRVINYTGEFQS